MPVRKPSRTTSALLEEQAKAEGAPTTWLVERAMHAMRPPMRPSRERQVLGDHLCDAWGLR